MSEQIIPPEPTPKSLLKERDCLKKDEAKLRYTKELLGEVPEEEKQVSRVLKKAIRLARIDPESEFIDLRYLDEEAYQEYPKKVVDRARVIAGEFVTRKYEEQAK